MCCICFGTTFCLTLFAGNAFKPVGGGAVGWAAHTRKNDSMPVGGFFYGYGLPVGKRDGAVGFLRLQRLCLDFSFAFE
jgi:hypothetical protein